jgi:hypothetical protein
MQSIARNEWLVDADVLAIWGAHRCLQAPKWSSAVFFFPNGFSPVCDADTLHVVGSYHDLTTCKVSEQNILFWLRRAAPDAKVILVRIHVIRSGFVREMFFLIS